MLVFVAYDISENKVRTNLIKKLRRYGLRRIQKSLFTGDLDLNKRIDISDEFEMFLSSENDSIILFQICNGCEESINIFSDKEIILHQEDDFKLI
jgi:CRISPR-associated protein Cas2